MSLGWGLVGTGAIASDFATALTSSSRTRVVNVVGRTASSGAAFADRHRVARASVTLDELLADPAVTAVYVATPHPLHEPNARAALDAGKAVLCEKPLALDAAGATRLCERARARGVFLMEAFMYRCHPILSALLARLAAGAIGAPVHLRASFGFRAPRDPASRLFDPRLGGGGILDVGGYPASLARLVASLTDGPGAPVEVTASGVVGPTGVDELASAELRFASGFSASLACAIRHDLGTAAAIYGEHGHIELPNPWLPGGARQGLESSFTVHREGEPAETVTARAPRPVYALEAELVADALAAGAVEPPTPAMSWRDSVETLRVLDLWRAALAGRARPHPELKNHEPCR